MISTWFLSIWITNAAATAMMYPIAYAIIQQLKETRWVSPEKDGALPTVIEMNANGTEVRGEHTSVEIDTDTKEPEKGNIQKTTDEGQLKEKPENIEEINEIDVSKNPEFIRIKKALTLCIAYGATAGGVAGITGSAANLVLKGLLYNSRGLGAPINFATWMAYGLPLSVVLLFVCWGWLYMIFLRCRDICSCMNKDNETRKLQAKKVRGLLEIEYKKLGSVTYGQGSVGVCFILLVIFWLTRDLGGVGGWGDLFEYNMTRDSTPAILLSFLLFVLPSRIPRVFCCRRNVYGMTEEERAEADAPFEPLMTWKFLHEKMPWNILFLLGGGFALATACQESGLSLWIGTQLETFRGMDPWLMLFVICSICTVATEVTSNGATANLILPILANLAIGTGVNPLFYMFPATLATTFAFMLPSATPGNAIVFGYSDIKVSDMSAYRVNHSTETAVLSVVDIFRSGIDKGKVGALVLLDLSAAFDTVDHDMLLQVLAQEIRLGGTALSLFSSHLSGRYQSVVIGDHKSSAVSLTCGVQQVSASAGLMPEHLVGASVAHSNGYIRERHLPL
ncbi:solute carrier family 13 member 2-like [Haliotis rubra]|uniref:solute carrier family 13 member 2-like n=1 Tax=Haliotis rubra TaxID=36100 RepID=UPI001EE514A7|nr:solute carrier family 13 member 2-like [Haliotis rubra]